MITSSYHLLGGGGEKREFSVHELRSARSGLFASSDASPSRTTEHEKEKEDPSSHQSARDTAVLSARLGVRSAISASTLNGSTAAPGFTLCISGEEVTSSLFMVEPSGAHKKVDVPVYTKWALVRAHSRVFVSATRALTGKVKNQKPSNQSTYSTACLAVGGV